MDPQLHPCTSDPETSSASVVLFGDSHALQWLPAISEAAATEGWEVTALTKAACPPPRILSARKDPEAGDSCERWRSEALTWLAETEPDLVILAGGGRIYKLVDSDGERIPDTRRTGRWVEGLADTLGACPGP